MWTEQNDQIHLIRPNGLSTDGAAQVVRAHWDRSGSNEALLALLAVRTMYECLVVQFERYKGCSLAPHANRKSGTVGDVDVLLGNRTVEAVEIKYGMAVSARHVSDAIEKIKAADVRRYYILATGGIDEDEQAVITEQIGQFYRTNGCEIIVNGVFETIRYYLRLIGSVDEFIARYVDHLATDDDLSYDHRTAWNQACEDASSASA